MSTTRVLFHDVRGVLGAASSNVEFVRARSRASELAPVLDEIANELRLVSDVIALAGADGEDRVVELDLRALLFVARGERPFTIDATQAPFTISGRRVELVAFAAAVMAASSRGARVEVAPDQCVIHGLDPIAARAVADKDVLAEACLSATVEGGSLILRRRD